MRNAMLSSRFNTSKAWIYLFCIRRKPFSFFTSCILICLRKPYRLLKGSFKWVYADFVKLKCTHFFFRKKGCNPFSSLFRWIQVQRFQTTPKLIHNSISQWLDIKIFTLYKTIAIFLRRKWWIFLFYFHLEIVFFGVFFCRGIW